MRLGLATPAALGLPAWEPPGPADTTSSAFSRCKEVSAEYTVHLRSHGVDARWIHVIGPRGDFPDADPRWHTVAQEHWHHYVTEVTDSRGVPTHVDWTARQFDPAVPYPLITEADEDQWEHVSAHEHLVAARYLASWRKQRAQFFVADPRAWGIGPS